MKLDTYTNGTRAAFVVVPDGMLYSLVVKPLEDSPELHVVRLSVAGPHYTHNFDASPWFNSEPEAMAELDRIAALISGETAPVGESWVEGPPPLTDGAWFVVVDEDRNIHVVQCVYPLAPKPWETAAGYPYASAEFTHHIPTPIQPPKETDE